jgi:hypothetical protein
VAGDVGRDVAVPEEAAMPIRRHRSPAERSGPPTGRPRRFVLALSAVAALVVVAALIGQGTSPSPAHRSAAGLDSSASASMPKTASEPSAAPSTTVAPGGAPRAGAAAITDGTATVGKTTSAAAAVGQIGAPVGPKVVRTGSIEIEVGRHRFDDASTRLGAIATGAGGFVSASETSSLDGDPHGTITLRVPVAAFDSVRSRVAKLGTVRSSTTGSQDVTGEYSDVAARIRALAKAESIGDILSVRDRLSAVQVELEQLQGRQQVLDDQTSLSTLTVALSEKGAPTRIDQPVERRGVAKMWHEGIGRVGDGGRAIVLGFAVMIPWLLLALVLWLPTRLLWRRLVVAPSPAPPGPAAPPQPVTTTD